jgi:hypothetical protein
MSTFPRSIWLSIAALGALLGLQTFVADGLTVGASVAPPGAAGAVGVGFVSGSPIELTQFDGSTARTTVLIRNDTDKKLTATLQPFLIDRRAWSFPWNEGPSVGLNPRSVMPVTVTVPLPPPATCWWPHSRLPARGIVTLSARGEREPGFSVCKSRDLIIAQKQPSSAELFVTVIGLAAAIALGMYGWIVSGQSNIAPTANPPTWTPQSWSTNLAIGGALVTSLLGITALPAQTHFATKTTYTTLSAFFAALVVLAPAVYGLLKADRAPSKATALRIFAFAAAITVWATIGQLGTAALLFLELSDARLVSVLAADAAAAVAAIVAMLVAIYGVRAINSHLIPAPAAGALPGGGPEPPPAAPPLRLL